MTVLFIIPSITNYYTFLEDIAAKLVEEGHSVHLASSSKHISDLDCYDRPIHGTFHEMDFPRGFEWKKHIDTANSLKKLVTQINPDVVNVHFSAAMFTTAIAKQDNWPKTIAMIHGMAFPILQGLRKFTVGTAERWAARKMDHVILLNEVDKIELSKHIPADRIDILQSKGLGCDTTKFDLASIGPETRLRYQRRLGIRKDDFVLIFIGRQVDFKGFDKLIRAFLSIYENHKNFKLLLVGAKDKIHPTGLNQEEKKALKHCPGILNLGWKENVHEYLCVADLNVFPSEREGMPVNLMESLALGIPVITTNSRGCNEVVQHGLNGIVMSKNNVETIAESILQLYEDRQQLSNLSKQALANRESFDRKYFIKAMLEIFEGLQTDLA